MFNQHISLTVYRLVSRSASMGDLRHLRGRRSADSALLSVYLHQVLLQREEEEAEEEGREHQSERSGRKNQHSSGEWRRPLIIGSAQQRSHSFNYRNVSSYNGSNDILRKVSPHCSSMNVQQLNFRSSQEYSLFKINFRLHRKQLG